MADIKIYGALACASGDRLTNAKEIRDDGMQATLGSSSSPTQADINEYLGAAALESVKFMGTLDVTSSSALATVQGACSADGDVRMWTCANASGETSGGYAVCASDLATALHSGDSRGVAVNLGDMLIGANIGGTVAVKCLPLNDAKKPADAGDVGTYGLMVPNDKAKLDQAVDDIDQTCFRCYSGQYNMNYCGWYGYYMYGTLGRPAGSSDGEYYVLRVANGGADGDYIVLEQTAYSCKDASRVFRRIVKTTDRSDMTDDTTTWGDWTKIGGVSLTETTYAELVALRDGGKLTPGAQYRITDYECTTAAADTQSAGHQFDIIVTADSEGVLSETARACRHDGDTYFENAKLEAWELSYCLDNDTARFDWADADNGKGVVYRMRDEWNNDCPYDFKNIQFKRWKITATTTPATDLVGYYFAHSTSMSGFTVDSADYAWCYTFNACEEGGEAEDASLQYTQIDDEGSSTVYPCHDNSIAPFAEMCYTLVRLNNIVFGASYLQYNDGVYGNTFAACCQDMTFGDCAEDNIFGNDCYSNIFGNDCYSNIFGNDCNSNIFGNSCNSNSFGNDCYENIFGNSCNSNIFGNSCNSNSFGNSCYSNSFGNDCYSNSFGNSCYFNSFGNDCYYNSFGNNASSDSADASARCNTVDSGCSYVTLTSGDTSGYIQYVHVCHGVKGTSTAKKEISVSRGLAYETEVKAAGSVTTEV